jgi:ABC-type phosphate/phosphonate transport system substrate-binding protein
VLDGGYDAGVLPREVFDAMASRGLRAIATLAPASQGVLVARASLPADEVRRLRRALLQLRRSSDGQRILQAISDETTGMTRARDEDFAELRKVLHAIDGG